MRKTLMSGLLVVAMLLGCTGLFAQYQTNVVQSNILSASGAATQTSVSIAGLNIGLYKLNWVATATVSACTVIVETGSDNITFGTTESTSTCTSSGETTAVDATARNFVRVRFSALTVSGGGSVKFTLTAPADSLNTKNMYLDLAQTITGNITPSGGITPNAGGAVAGGVSLSCATGSPAAGSTGTNTTGVANQLWATTCYIPSTTTITTLSFLCGGTCTTDKGVIGIWNIAGTLLACSATTAGGGTTLSGANTWQKYTLSASCPNGAVTLTVQGPTWLIIGVITNGTTAGSIQTYPLANGATAFIQASQATLATFTPTFAQTVSVGPYIQVN